MLGDLARLDWLPKAFGPGDLDGDGWLKLLGKPDVDLPSMLVRETAQNSWDARDRRRTPVFDMHLRTLSGPALSVLRRNILTGGGGELKLDRLLEQSRVRVLEISDRGTHGLRGPVRNDKPIPHGTPTDFVDFVLGVGAPPDNPRSGGSYGFGKVVTYMTSSVGTILIWSRTDTARGLEDRLIASAIGSSFVRGGQRFTGRHWWGIETAPSEGGPVQPLRGQLAASLAGQVFSRGFEPRETGTSLLIIDPRLGEADDDEGLIEQWRMAIRRNLWPKLIQNQATDRRMDISLRHDGSVVDLRAHDPRLEAFEECLKAVRREQSGDEGAASPLVHVEEVRSLRPQKLVGHVAMTRFIRPNDGEDDLTHHVCLMRNEAELVVKYEAFPQSTDGLTAWAGVFKPVPELDPIYSQSEPPAHDDWVPKSLTNKTDRTLVNTCYTKTKDIVAEYLAPKTVPTDSDGQVSAGDLSFALAAFAGSTIGGRPLPTPPSQRGNRGPGRPRKRTRVRMLSAGPVAGANGQRDLQHFHVRLSVEGRSGQTVEVAPCRLGWAVEGGREQDSTGQLGEPPRLTRWILQTASGGTYDAHGETVSVQAGESLIAEIVGAHGRALDVDFTVIGDDA